MLPAVRRFALLALLLPTGLVAQRRTAPPRDYVLVHGAWGGGWDWKAVDSALTAQGQRVHRVTLTGLGERAHLANASIGLQVHIMDVVNTLRYEGLRDVVLVGHSYGGMVITGAADQASDRVAQVVYVDAFLPDSGESVQSLAGEGFNALVQQSARDGMIIPAWVPAGAPEPKDVPHPLRTLTDTLPLTNPAARRIPGHYILTLDPGATTDDFSPSAARAQQRGFVVDTLRTGHSPNRTMVRELVRLLRR